DGKSLLYANRRLYIAAPDGSQFRPITTGIAQEFDAIWSPDGTEIAFVRSGADRKLNIWLMDASGAGQRQLTHIPAEEGQPEWPAWSPNGRRLAIQVGEYSSQKRASHIWMIDVATGEARKLAAHAESYLDETPAWFPDGKRLAFQSSRSGSMEV